MNLPPPPTVFTSPRDAFGLTGSPEACQRPGNHAQLAPELPTVPIASRDAPLPGRTGVQPGCPLVGLGIFSPSDFPAADSSEAFKAAAFDALFDKYWGFSVSISQPSAFVVTQKIYTLPAISGGGGACLRAFQYPLTHQPQHRVLDRLRRV